MIVYRGLLSSIFLLSSFFFTVISYAGSDDKSAKVESKIFALEDCPVTGPLKSSDKTSFTAATMASAIVVPLVNSVVDLGVNAIKEAAKDKDFQLQTPTPIYKDFYKIGIAGNTTLNPELGCIVIARGEFEVRKFENSAPNKTKKLNERITEQFRSKIDDDHYVTLKKENLEFYFEAATILSPNGKEFKLRPQALHISKFISPNGFFGPKQRNYAVTISYSKPFYEETFSSVVFKFPNLKLNSSITTCDLISKQEYKTCNETKDGFGELSSISLMMPASEELSQILKSRKTVALILETAASKNQPPEKPIYPEDNKVTLQTLNDYCDELNNANQLMSVEHKVWDDSCPSELLLAKRAYEYEQLKEIKRIEKVKADTFWTKNCATIDKNESEKSNCLNKIYEKDLKTSGLFKLSATVIETREGNKLAKLFTPVAEKLAPDLKASLINELDPVARQKAKEEVKSKSVAEAKAQRTANLNLIVAKSEVSIAQIDVDKAVDDLNQDQDPSKLKDLNKTLIEKQMVLLKKQSSANEMARISGVSIPYPEIE